MPIDASIYGDLAKGFNNPFEKLGEMTQQARQMVQLGEEQRKAQKSRAVQDVWMQLGGSDIKEALRRTYEIDPETASEIEARYAAGKAAWALEHDRTMENERKQTKDDFTRLWGARGDPVLFDKRITEIETRTPDFKPTAAALRGPNGQAVLAQLFEAQGNIDQIFDRRQQATAAFVKGDEVRGAAGLLASAHGTPEFDEILQNMAPHIGPAYTKLFSTASAEQLERFSLTTDQRIDNKQAQTTNERMLAQNAAQAAEQARDNARSDAMLAVSQGHLAVAQQNAGKAGQQKPLTATSEANLTDKLSQRWLTSQKSIRELRRQVTMMDAGMAAGERGDMGPASEAVLQTFLKVLDEGSVVREGEFWRLQAGAPWIARAQAAVQRITKGGVLPLDELKKYARLAHEMYDAQGKFTAGTRARIEANADRYGIPHELIFDDAPTTTEEGGEPPPPPGGAAPAPFNYAEYLRRKKGGK